MGRNGTLDYGRWARPGFLLGLGLFVFGAGGEILGHSLFGSRPAWENTLFTSSEGVGLLVGVVSTWIFGLALPLTE